MTLQRARDRARPTNEWAPERTCFRCDGVFRVASDDHRVYCPACRTAYGFPAPAPVDYTPGAQLPLFAEVRSA